MILTKTAEYELVIERTGVKIILAGYQDINRA